jgi:hypothetical protein
VHITVGTAQFLGECDIADPTYSPSPAPKSKQTTDE